MRDVSKEIVDSVRLTVSSRLASVTFKMASKVLKREIKFLIYHVSTDLISWIWRF